MANAVKKQKTLIPSLKENQRYVVYSIDSMGASISFDNQTHNYIATQCINMLGIFESAKAGVMTAKNKDNKGILRVNSRYLDKLKICLGLIKNLKTKTGEVPVAVESIYVSGMLNKAEDMLK